MPLVLARAPATRSAPGRVSTSDCLRPRTVQRLATGRRLGRMAAPTCSIASARCSTGLEADPWGAADRRPATVRRRAGDCDERWDRRAALDDRRR